MPVHKINSRHLLREPSVIAALLAVLAGVAVGIPAGLDPKVAIGVAAALVFVALIMSDVTLGLMCFGLLAFFLTRIVQ